MDKSKRIVESFNCAIEGIIEVIKNETHMRVHFYITVLVLVFSLFVDLNKIEVALLSIAISLVWIAEIFNTAIEAVVDMYMKEYHDLAKLAKDAGAGGVFVAAVNSMIIGYFVFYDHFEEVSNIVLMKIKNSPVHTSFVSIIIVIVIVIGLKAYFRTGTPLRGGMPSGHSAVAFAIWVSILFISENIYVYLLSFFMAILVAQTRVKAGIHSFKEVVYGSIVGGGITFILLSILKRFN